MKNAKLRIEKEICELISVKVPELDFRHNEENMERVRYAFWALCGEFFLTPSGTRRVCGRESMVEHLKQVFEPGRLLSLPIVRR